MSTSFIPEATVKEDRITLQLRFPRLQYSCKKPVPAAGKLSEPRLGPWLSCSDNSVTNLEYKKTDQNIPQLDGNITLSSNNTNDSHENTNDTTSCDDTEYTSENEAFSDPIAANLFLSPDQHCLPGEPPDLQVGLATDPDHPINIPLCLLINARSIFNKADNLNKMLNQIGPDLCIISETFERNNKKLSSIFTSKHFERIFYFRKNKAPETVTSEG